MTQKMKLEKPHDGFFCRVAVKEQVMYINFDQKSIERFSDKEIGFSNGLCCCRLVSLDGNKYFTQ